MTDDDTATLRPDDSLAVFKEAFRRHAAGVAVVTARDSSGTPVGFTATSLASLAAVPPLATFNMARTASSWPAVAETDQVIVHLLGLRNRDLARRMAGPAAERFAGDHWTEGPNGVPLLNGVTAWMTGTVVERVPVHGSAVIVVRVGTGGVGRDDDALLYHDRHYLRPVRLED